eukprot:8144410-Alexandrium_andersonii.AAC.1
MCIRDSYVREWCLRSCRACCSVCGRVRAGTALRTALRTLSSGCGGGWAGLGIYGRRLVVVRRA